MFEKVFNVPFVKSYPDWLREGKKRRELDGYSKELGLAFEHHGMQHFEAIDKFSTQLEEQRRRDRFKRKKCRETAVKLIEMGPIPERIPVHQVKAHFIQKLEENNLSLSKAQNKRLRLLNIDSAFNLDEVSELGRMIEGNGGKLLSKTYPGMSGTVDISCNVKDHPIFSPKVYRGLKGSWCKICSSIKGASSRKLSISTLRDWAKKNKWKLKSTVYINSNSKMQWICSNDHVVWYSWNYLQQGHRCGYCSGRRNTAAQAKKNRNEHFASFNLSNRLWAFAKWHRCPLMLQTVFSDFARNT